MATWTLDQLQPGGRDRQADPARAQGANSWRRARRMARRPPRQAKGAGW